MVPLPDLSRPFDWQPLLQHCGAVVHLAGIAHTFADDDRYDRVNHQATEALDGEKGNFATVRKISRLPIPLPFGGLTAQRSVLSVQNFCSAVAVALTDCRTRGETFIVSDPTPLTVSDFIARYRARLGRAPWLIAIPERWLELLLKAIGKDAIWQRIGCPLIARPTKLLALGWKPS